MGFKINNCHPERASLSFRRKPESIKSIADVIARTAFSREKQSILIKKQDGLLRFTNAHTRNDGAGGKIVHNSEQRTR